MILFDFLFVGAVLLAVSWFLWLSPSARSLKELTELNRVWEEFNVRVEKNKEITDLELKLIRDWKYQGEKVEMLQTFMKMYKEALHESKN